MRRGLKINAKMLPFSTYADNSLAAAATIGTLGAMRKLPIEAMAISIESTIALYLDSIVPEAFKLTVYGALCIMDTGDAVLAKSIADDCYREGVIISQAGSVIRLFPPLTIEQATLEKALGIFANSIIKNSTINNYSDRLVLDRSYSASKTAHEDCLHIR